MTDEAQKTLSGWWALGSVAAGLVVVILLGQILAGGSAEIAGVMVASVILCVRASWSYRPNKWFVPVVAGWTVVQLVAFVLIVVPIGPAPSKLFIQLAWVEFFAFAGLIWLAGRISGASSKS